MWPLHHINHEFEKAENSNCKNVYNIEAFPAEQNDRSLQRD